MFREPIGEYPVSCRKVDTEEIGTGERRRRVTMTVFYPSEQAELLEREKPFPVVFYQHGLGGKERESSVLCEDLASCGYVVVSVGHPYGGGGVCYTDGSTFEDPEPFEEIRYRLEEIEPLWYEDLLAAAAQMKADNTEGSLWKGKLLMSRLSVLGVSFGGCCSVCAVLKSDIFGCAVNLDGSMFVRPEYRYLDKPILVRCSDRNVKAYIDLCEKGCTAVTVEKLKKRKHWEFSDGIYLCDKGKNNRSWADKTSIEQSLRIVEFLQHNLL